MTGDRPFLPVPALLAIALGMSASPANAEVTRLDTNAAVAACRAALPAYQEQLRFRPLSVQNEGNTGVFVTCAFENAHVQAGVTPAVGIVFRNDGNVDRTSDCTLIDSTSLVSGPYWRFSGLELPAATAGIEVELRVSAVPPYSLHSTAVSCRLPPGTGIAAVWREYVEQVDL